MKKLIFLSDSMSDLRKLTDHEYAQKVQSDCLGIYLCIRLCVHVCLCTCMHIRIIYMCTRRIGQNVPESSPVADTVPVERQQCALQDDHYSSTVDHMKQQMLTISGNPAYYVPSHNQKPIQEDDPAYSKIDISQQEEAITSGEQGSGTALGAAASVK